MVATARQRPLPILLLCVGVVAFGLGLLTMVLRAPTPGARAQAVAPSDCSQPSAEGCALFLEVPAQAVPNDPTVAHNWLVDIPEGLDFAVAAANLPADLELWVYGPDGALLRQSNLPGYKDEIVQVTNVGAGLYWIVVDSPGGDWSNDPYTMLATTRPLLSDPPLDPYGIPTQFILAY
jgi:hypothetical protein